MKSLGMLPEGLIRSGEACMTTMVIAKIKTSKPLRWFLEKNDYQNEVFIDMSTSDEVAKELSTGNQEQETPVNDISCVTEVKENTEDRQCLLEELQVQVIMVRVDSS